MRLSSPAFATLTHMTIFARGWTAKELAADLRQPLPAIKGRLNYLSSLGFVDSNPLSPRSAGRPEHCYSCSADGAAEVTETWERAYQNEQKEFAV
jgi:predicted ArsR family transcriptional regulator